MTNSLVHIQNKERNLFNAHKNFSVQAEQGKTDMENYIARLEEEKAGLEKEVSDLNAVNPHPLPPSIR